MIIDVSEHNGKLDWEKLKPQIEGAIIRCGFGSDYTKQDDAYYSRNVSECERLGIPYGVYIYSYANTVAKAKSEASHVKRLVEGHKLSFPIFYDLEEEKYSSYATKMAETWMAEMSGFDVGIYANVNWWKNYIKCDCKNKWVAYWGKTQPSISNMVLWQYSENGKVAGISGFDLNKNISLPIPQPEPQPTPEPPKPEPTSEDAGIWKTTAVHGLNMRTGAGTNNSIITCIPNGSQVACYGESSGDWLKVTWNGKTGWCCKDYLSKYSDYDKSMAGTYKVTAKSGLWMRTGAGTGNSKIKCMSSGSTCTCEGFIKDGWLRVTQGSTGWSSSDYLSKK